MGDDRMCFIRIGDKLLDEDKIYKSIDKILLLRSQGKSQQEVADIMGIQRTFISRLEALGEIRKGRSVALIGFPIKNKREVKMIADKYGIEYTLLMTEEERWDFIKSKSGLELFDDVLEILSRLRKYDLVITLLSDKRNELMEKLIDKKTLCVNIGSSPLTSNVYIETEKLENILKHTRMRRGNKYEENC